MNIAETILDQIGGNKFIVMTGSKNFLNIGNGLRMNLTRNKSKAQYLKIELNACDTYTMKFFSARRTESDIIIKDIETISGVYADQMARIFEQVTGLYTRLY